MDRAPIHLDGAAIHADRPTIHANHCPMHMDRFVIGTNGETFHPIAARSI